VAYLTQTQSGQPVLILKEGTSRSRGKEKDSQHENLGTKPVTYFTAFGTLTRVALSTFVTYILYRFLLPLVGLSLSDAQIMALIPVVMLFDLTLSLYTIPIGYLMARIVSRYLEIGNQ
jgi:hypothetical protein